MAPILEDPRLRHRWNQISQNAESATETAAANIWSFQHKYMNPCFTSMVFGIEKCIGRCFPNRDERAWRRTRCRAEASFDFYDDWDEDDYSRNHGLLGNWGNDELGRLLAGNGSHSNRADGINQQPRRKRAMSYGTRARRKSIDNDPTVIPSTSALGFLGRLPFKLGGTLRYKPSAADLQDHPGKYRNQIMNEQERVPLISDENFNYRQDRGKGHKRNRSSTTSSDETSNSFRSRRDLLPSDEEEDAVPLSDEFSLDVLRKNTGFGVDDDFRQKRTTKSEILEGSGNSSIIISPVHEPMSRSKLMLLQQHTNLTEPHADIVGILSPAIIQTPSILEIQSEEDLVIYEQEIEVENKKARSL